MSIATMIDRAAPSGVRRGEEVLICDARERGGVRLTLAFDGSAFSAYLSDERGREQTACALTKEQAVSTCLDRYLDRLSQATAQAPAEVREADAGAEELLA